jgi:hypothetical protein
MARKQNLTREDVIMIRYARLICATCAIWSMTATIAFGQAVQTSQSSAASQELSGVWVGQMSENLDDGRVGHSSLYLRLRQSGAQVSGVAGDSETTAASPIEHVALSGKHLTFSMTAGPDRGVLWTIELDASGDAMEGKGHALRSSDNHTWDVEITIARNK